jgi:hypothetical protein
MTIGATVLAATFVLGGGAAAAGALTSGGSPAVAQQPAAATAPAAPSASASPSPKATPSGSSGTHNGPTYNGPVTIINQAPQPGSTVYVPVPSSAPAYFTSSQDVVQEYYAYLNNKDFQAAWGLGGNNLNHGTGYDAWVAGYSTTSWITLGTWEYYPGYNAVGVTITAGQTDGSVRTYSGSYTVNNGVITSASIVQASGGSAPSEAPLQSGLRYVGSGVYAGPNTSDAFALAVHQAYLDGDYWHQPGTSQFYAYSSATGQSYLMTSSSVGNPVVVTGGNGALVQFNH